jgi:small ligand-binding sensory domain FIST
VVHGLESFSADALLDRGRSYFSVEEVDPSLNAARALAILRAAGKSGTALIAVTSDRAFLFDTTRAHAATLFQGFSLRQQSLDVVQLHKCLLEGVLAISEEAIREQKNVSYIRDAGEAMARVRDGSANVAFLMNPVRMQQVRDIAFAGEVLPQKSTDFYPKLLSGLTIYALE